jgi:uncharacterized membrane protein
MAAPGYRDDPAFWIILALAVLLLSPTALWWGFGGRMLGLRLPSAGGWGLGGLAGFAVFVVALILVAKAFSMTPTRRRRPSRQRRGIAQEPPADPRRILDARYAKGEITLEKYVRLRAEQDRRAH